MKLGKYWTAFIGFALFGALGFLLSRFGSITTIECWRGQDQSVNCVKQEVWLGVIKVREETLTNVIRAFEDSVCSNGDCSRRVILEAENGSFPMFGYTSDFDKFDMVFQNIKAFINAASSDRYVYQERLGLAGVVGIVCSFAGMIGGLFIIIKSGVLKRP